MPSVDLDKIFSVLGVVTDRVSGDEIRGFCPDHHLFTGRRPSDPNWVINKETGETFCFTEGRGSNLVWIVCRLLGKEPDDAAKFLTGSTNDVELADLKMKASLMAASKMRNSGNSPEPDPIKGLDVIEKESKEGRMSERAYQFFMSPPGKKRPTNIRKETVDKFGVFERTWGYYKSRVIIPYYMVGKIVGFCAIDLLGIEEWKKVHPTQDEKSYRKVLYPDGFASSECLFGYDDIPVGADVFVVEGAREVMKLRQEGFNAVAILGAYMSPRQKELLLAKAPRRLFLMFDGDQAGAAITRRVADFLKHNDCYRDKNIVKVIPPIGADPKNLDRQQILDLLRLKKIVDLP